ncbi:hypothetical protein BS78_06G017900 [Paspalum vaginatum]|nr:hypothetical protein BS78_06G017900 [Paspalum vaginatum]
MCALCATSRHTSGRKLQGLTTTAWALNDDSDETGGWDNYLHAARMWKPASGTMDGVEEARSVRFGRLGAHRLGGNLRGDSGSIGRAKRLGVRFGRGHNHLMATELAALPDDALAGVLRALPPKSLAVARCVCKAWRDVVDGRALLRPYLLPRSVRGVFINYIDHYRPHLFTRPVSPSTIPRVDVTLSFLPNAGRFDWWSAVDHCNGLLLCAIDSESQLCICSPATRRWTVLPPAEKLTRCWWTVVGPHADGNHHRYAGAYIAFDPAVSPHYEVVLIPAVPDKPSSTPSVDDEVLERELDACCLMEWPPSPWTLRVFSSTTGCWEERAFIREGMPAGTLSLLKGTFQIIEAPSNIKRTKPYLGKLRNSVCFGIVHDEQLKIWILNESFGKIEWVLKCATDVGNYAKHLPSIPFHNGSWNDSDDDDDVENLSEKSSYEWDSDDDDTFTVNSDDQNYYDGNVLFLTKWFRVVAYHLNSSKIQHLGNSRPNCYYHNHTNGIYESFIYTPCMIQDMLHGDQTGQSSCED